MPRNRTVNIDEPMDLHVASALMKLIHKKKLKPIMSYNKAQKKIEFSTIYKKKVNSKKTNIYLVFLILQNYY